MSKPTVENIEVVYDDKSKRYAVIMVVDTISSVQYIALDHSKYKDTVVKYALEIADRLGVNLIDETKEDITISGEVSSDQIEKLTDGQRIITDKCIIYKTPMPDQYYFTYADGYSSTCDTAEEIAEAVNNYEWD